MVQLHIYWLQRDTYIMIHTHADTQTHIHKASKKEQLKRATKKPTAYTNVYHVPRALTLIKTIYSQRSFSKLFRMLNKLYAAYQLWGFHSILFVEKKRRVEPNEPKCWTGWTQMNAWKVGRAKVWMDGWIDGRMSGQEADSLTQQKNILDGKALVSFSFLVTHLFGIQLWRIFSRQLDISLSSFTAKKDICISQIVCLWNEQKKKSREHPQGNGKVN